MLELISSDTAPGQSVQRSTGSLWPLVALALGGFGIGLTEFVASGLLPQIAHDLLRRQYDDSNSAGIGHAGWMISAYALGCVTGAPLVAFVTARIARKQLVLWLLVLFVFGTLASSVAPNFTLLLVARFVAGLPHGAYFGAAGMLAAAIMGPGRHARGFAVVLSGLTAANLIGIPLITRLGQATSWRAAYIVIAAVFALTFVAVMTLVPSTTERPTGSVRDELTALRSRRVWVVIVMVSLGFSGFFAVQSYIAPVTTELAHLSGSAVPWVLVAVGFGMTVGNAVGGWYSDRNVVGSLLLGFPLFIGSMFVFVLTASNPIGLFIGAFLVGATAVFLGPAMQALLIAVAPNAVLMGAALNQSAMNLANSLGAAVGAAAIGHGLGYRAPTYIGIAISAVGWALAVATLNARRSPDLRGSAAASPLSPSPSSSSSSLSPSPSSSSSSLSPSPSPPSPSSSSGSDG